jgi:hypothetical protein
MNKKQISFYQMCLAVQLVYEKYKTQIEAIPVLKKEFEIFLGLLATFEGLKQDQESYTRKAYEDRDRIVEALVVLTLKLSNLAYVCASDNNLADLMEKSEVTKTALEKMVVVTFDDHCRGFYNLLMAQDVATLAAYQIEQADLAAYKAYSDQLKALIAQPRVKVVERTQATDNITDVIDQIRKQFSKKLDKLVEAQRSVYPAFCDEYFAARIVIGSRGKNAADHDATIETPNS